MLIQLSFRNFKAFKEEVKLTLFASKYDKTTLEADNVFEVPKFGLRLLKSAVIYGANASGKTKVVDAANFMKSFINDSSKESQRGELIAVEPFRLSTATENEPSMFEAIFIHKDEMFRYGFEVTKTAVVSEWLYHRPNTKEVEIFYRDGQEFSIHPRLFRKGTLFVKEKMVRSNALMLSVAAQFNDELAERVVDWFGKFNQLSGLHEDLYMGYSIGRTQVVDYKTQMLSLLKGADIGIEDLKVSVLDANNLPKDLPKETKDMIVKKIREDGTVVFGDMRTMHPKFNEEGLRVGLEEFDMNEQESSGTRKFFALTGPLMNVLEEGQILLVDELDSKIHPNLVSKLVALFNSAKTNPKNAQLIFNTHDTNLLGQGIFRRDQIWFTEKDRYGAASLYSLATFKTDEVRKNDNFEDNYLSGRYGGVPVLGDFSNTLQFETAD